MLRHLRLLELFSFTVFKHNDWKLRGLCYLHENYIKTRAKIITRYWKFIYNIAYKNLLPMILPA